MPCTLSRQCGSCSSISVLTTVSKRRPGLYSCTRPTTSTLGPGRQSNPTYSRAANSAAHRPVHVVRAALQDAAAYERFKVLPPQFPEPIPDFLVHCLPRSLPRKEGVKKARAAAVTPKHSDQCKITACRPPPRGPAHHSSASTGIRSPTRFRNRHDPTEPIQYARLIQRQPVGAGIKTHLEEHRAVPTIRLSAYDRNPTTAVGS